MLTVIKNQANLQQEQCWFMNMMYGLVGNQGEAEKIQLKIQAFLGEDKGGEVFVAKANNRGAIIKAS